MNVEIAPSIMCADYANLEATVREVERLGADMLHVDIMDGVYVPNLVVGPDYVNTLRRLTSLPLDMHLMCVAPERFLPMFDPKPGERICFHPESTFHAHKLVVDIHKRGCKAGLALGPALPVSAIEELITEIDFITVMTIDTGVAGSTFLPQALDKIERAKEMARATGREIYAQVDGSICFDNVRSVIAKGADVLILGYAGCFNKELGTEATLNRMKEIIKDA